MRPNAPSRATAKYSLNVGLLSVPVGLYSGCEDSGIARKMTDGNGTPLGMVIVRKAGEGYDTSQVFARNEVVYVVDSERGPVPLTDDEIVTAAGLDPKNKVMQIEAFQPLDMLCQGAYIPENLYQLRSKEGAKILATLLTAMETKGVFALVKYPSRNYVRYGALLPDGRLFSLRYSEEVREDADLPLDVIGKAELAMAENLVDALTEVDPLDLTDEVSARVREYAENKAQGILPEVTAEAPAVSAPDFMAALSATVDGLKNAKKGNTPAKKVAAKKATPAKKKARA